MSGPPRLRDSPATARRGARTASTRRRALWLAAGVAGGAAIGLLGRWLGAGDAGFLAIPLALAIGWLGLADPTRCAPDQDARSRRDSRQP